MDEIALGTPFKKGAEANLYRLDWHEKDVIIKKRLPKAYRTTQLDQRIRNFRTTREPHLLHEAKKAGVTTPIIFLVDVKNSMIIMEHIEGQQLKKLLNQIPNEQRREVSQQVGELVGRLHKHGIIHGDLTTSNMILNPEGKIVFVDFGLGEKSSELEAMAVDLHLMKRALQSTHYSCAEGCFQWIMEGYAKICGSSTARKVEKRITEIELRGRYVVERKHLMT